MGLTFTRRTVLLAGIVAAASGCVGMESGSAPVVQTRKGRVRGFVRNGASIFLGMPYGASTAGKRRFMPPAEPAAWTGVRDATQFGQRAPQASPVISDGAKPIYSYFTGGRQSELELYGNPMGEDCLVVNVLTPAADRANRPVLFYIHGGGFNSGSGNAMTLSERLVMEEDVVVVTVNHRLGPLGFMYLGGVSSKYADGNPGMLDLVAALKWVQQNISAFGGDPQKVTLFGESGGGAKIALLSTMHQAKGLFRAAIVQSGLMVDPLPPTNEAATSVMSKLGLSTLEVDKLQDIPLDQLLGAIGAGVGYVPVADGRTFKVGVWDSEPAFAADVPMIVGYCADEHTLFSLADFLQPLDWSGVVSKLQVTLGLDIASIDTVISGYRTSYPDAVPHEIYSRILSDGVFGRNMHRLAKRKALQSSPVYFYRMEYTPPALSFLRAFHTVELPLVGRMVAEPHGEGLSKQLGAAWAAFARTGDPNHSGIPTWGKVSGAANKVMLFDNVSRFGNDPQALARETLENLAKDDLKYRLLKSA